MTIQFIRPCTADGNPTPACHADFKIDGRSGHQKLGHGETVALEAIYQNPEAHYDWDVVSTPPNCPNQVIPISLYEAKLLLPQPGAYVVQLSVNQGDCRAQTRYILWVLTPRLLYSIPAASEPLRLHGKPEWAGDLARLMLDVDQNLPTEAEKTAMTKANAPGRDNPFATLNDLPPPYSTAPETLTPEQLAAIRLANDPSGRNPFLTEQDLHERPKIGVTRAEKDAMEIADNPCGENPFVTRRELPIGVSRAQKQALNATEAKESLYKPSADNAFVTETMLPDINNLVKKHELPSGKAPSAWPLGVTSNQREALDAAEAKAAPHLPSVENPFVTQSMLPLGVTSNQREALDAAEAQTTPHLPSAENPFVTQRMLPLGVIASQRAALDAADRQELPHKPSETNAFVTQSMLPLGVTASQRAALDAAEARELPYTLSAENSFVTQRMLPPGELVTKEELPSGLVPPTWPTGVTALQRAALDAAEAQEGALKPGPTNPFVTKNMLPQNGLITKDDLPDGPVPTTWPVGLTASQKAALDAAEDQEVPDKPGDDNPFVTLTMLPLGVTNRQRAALDAAEANAAPHKPGTSNAFVTESMLPLGVTNNQREALNASDARAIPHKPSDSNPFVTETMLPIGVTNQQRAALDAAEAQKSPHKPSADNAFVTQTMLPDVGNLVHKDELPGGPVPSTWPIGVTVRQKAALDAAEAKDELHKPSDSNPFVTQSMLSNVDQQSAIRVVAAGCLDLAKVEEAPGKTVGGLNVLDVDLSTGRATLSFTGYTAAAQAHYVVKALPINSQAGRNASGAIIVQFVEFTAQGFVLNMCHIPDGQHILGPCMIEVTELSTLQQSALTLEQAIYHYYSLIQNEKYEEAWPMLSAQFKRSLTPALKSLEDYKTQWKSSGYAEIKGMELIQTVDHTVTYLLDLDYPKAFPEKRHKIRYIFKRDEAEGHIRFNYWLFIGGQQLSPPKTSFYPAKPV